MEQRSLSDVCLSPSHQSDDDDDDDDTITTHAGRHDRMPNTTAHSSHPEARRAGAAAGTEGIARSSRSASLAFLASTPQQHPATAPYAPTPTPPATNSGFVVTSRGKPYLPPLLHASPFPSSPSSPHPDGPLQAKTTLHLSSSVDAKGRRMVNQYVRLKTIGQGSHGKVWLCAEPTLRESDEDSERTGGERTPEEGERRKRRGGKDVQSQWEEELETGDVKYCAIKSVAREGVGRGKSLRMAKGRKAEVEGGGGGAGIGADDKVKREVAIMKRLDHKNVVRLREVIDDSKSKKVFMGESSIHLCFDNDNADGDSGASVLEFMAGGQVVWQDVNKRPALTVDEARRTFRDVVLGLEYREWISRFHTERVLTACCLSLFEQSTTKGSSIATLSPPTSSGRRTTRRSRFPTLESRTCQTLSCVHPQVGPKETTTRRCARLLAVPPSSPRNCVTRQSTPRPHRRYETRTRTTTGTSLSMPTPTPLAPPITPSPRPRTAFA